MKRILVSATLFGALGLFIGCGEEEKKETKVTAPGGTATTTESVKTTGSNPPAPAKAP